MEGRRIRGEGGMVAVRLFARGQRGENRRLFLLVEPGDACWIGQRVLKWVSACVIPGMVALKAVLYIYHVPDDFDRLLRGEKFQWR